MVFDRLAPVAGRLKPGRQDAIETLNFEKSRVGLGDIYAKQYEASPQSWSRCF